VRPELPFLAAGGVAVVGGFAREKHWPKEGTAALIGTGVTVIVASATAGTRIAPIVRAMGLLILLVSVIASVPVLQASQAKKGKK
jgi:peptidoglycan/LPS O-acetylase OafA/YrhL